MKKLMIFGICSVFLLTACKKGDQSNTTKSIEQEKIEFQAHLREIEREKIAIENEKVAYERTQDSIARAEKKKHRSPEVTASRIYRHPLSSAGNSGTYHSFK